MLNNHNIIILITNFCVLTHFFGNRQPNIAKMNLGQEKIPASDFLGYLKIFVAMIMPQVTDHQIFSEMI